MSIKLTDNEANIKLQAKHGNKIKCLDKYKGSTVKHSFECLVCCNTWITTFDSVVNGGKGCPRCSRIRGGRKSP